MEQELQQAQEVYDLIVNYLVTYSFQIVAAIGALSLGAGLALQGLLSNYGAGVSIIVARPFVVGDTISVQGVTGVVK